MLQLEYSNNCSIEEIFADVFLESINLMENMYGENDDGMNLSNIVCINIISKNIYFNIVIYLVDNVKSLIIMDLLQSVKGIRSNDNNHSVITSISKYFQNVFAELLSKNHISEAEIIFDILTFLYSIVIICIFIKF